MAALDEKMADLAQQCVQLEANHKVSGKKLDPQYKVPLEQQKKVTKNISDRPPAKTPLPTGSESEHIYESIPDVTESDEPIYCVPYEPGQTCHRQHQAVAGSSHGKPKSIHLQPQQQQQQQKQQSSGRGTRGSGTSSSSGGSGREWRAVEKQQSIERWVRDNPHPRSPTNTKSTPAPVSNSSKRTDAPLEERDSSSAYNTGDSTGSTHRLPPTLELSLGQDPSLRQSTLTLCPPTHDQSLQVSLLSFLRVCCAVLTTLCLWKMMKKVLFFFSLHVR